MREIGDEYGATTGRPRRCGWLDTVLARRSVRLNGMNGLSIMKLDVLIALRNQDMHTIQNWKEILYRTPYGCNRLLPMRTAIRRNGRMENLHQEHKVIRRPSGKRKKISEKNRRTCWHPDRYHFHGPRQSEHNYLT